VKNVNWLAVPIGYRIGPDVKYLLERSLAQNLIA
jgi:hypothetical protein